MGEEQNEKPKREKRTTYDWELLKQIYMSDPSLDFRDLSIEGSGLPDRPALVTIKAHAAKHKWKINRDAALQERYKDPAMLLDRSKISPSKRARIDKAIEQETKTRQLTTLLDIERDLISPVFSDEDKGYALADLPQHLHDRYASAVTDPHLMNLRRDVALISSLISACTVRMQSGDPSGKAWKRLRGLAIEVIAAKKNGDELIASHKLSELLRLVSRGCPEVELQDELIKLIDSRLRTIAAEANRLKLLQEYVAREDALNIARQFAEAVKLHVHDAKALRAIATEFTRIRQGIDLDLNSRQQTKGK